MSHNKQKWVIVFLVYADFRIHSNEIPNMSEKLKTHLNIMFKDIMDCPINNETARLFVVYQSIRYSTSKQPTGSDELTLLFEVKNLSGINYIEKPFVFGSEEEAKTSNEIDGIFHPNMQQPDKLAAILEKTKIEENEEVFLMTWDHGSAFGIFKTSPAIEQMANAMRTNNILKDNEDFIGLFWNKALENKRLKEIADEQEKLGKEIIIQKNNKNYKLLAEQKNHSFPLELLQHQENLNLFNIQKESENILLILKEEYSKNNLLDATNITQNQKKIIEEQSADKAIPILATKLHEILKNTELAAVLQSWLKGRKVGVLLMMNCWMMNLHTLYSLKSTVKCLVAPQTSIDSPGYNYHDILNFIYQHTATPLTFEELGKTIIAVSHNDFIRNRAKRISPDGTDSIIEYMALFAINLTGQENEKSPFNQIIAKIKEIVIEIDALVNQDDSNSTVINLIRYLRLLSFDFTSKHSYMIDFPNWFLASTDLLFSLDNLKYKAYKELPTKEPNRFDLAYKSNKLIIEKFLGKKTYFSSTSDFNSDKYEQDVNIIANRTQTGLSLFFPNKKIYDEDLLDYIKSDPLLSCELQIWATLLKKVFGKNLF